VADQLHDAGVQVETVLITTQGDAQPGPIGSLGSQGVFTKEIQRALLDNRVDLAVHSLKDLPTEPIEGLSLAAVPERASPRDVLVSRDGCEFEQLAEGAQVGTGSMRRRAQLLHARNDLRIEDIRGNVETRLRRLDEGQYDAIVLAEAGLRRLGLQQRITHVFDSWMLPAIGQGALGLETRADDDHTQSQIACLDHAATHQAVVAERALLAALHGGCLAPIGAWARIEQDTLILDAAVLDPAGQQRIETQVRGAAEAATSLGQDAARQLLDQGADRLIAASRNS
jgi:hydroxymethylbilane synthase